MPSQKSKLELLKKQWAGLLFTLVSATMIVLVATKKVEVSEAGGFISVFVIALANAKKIINGKEDSVS